MTRSAARITRPPEPDPFRYGWRFVKKVRSDGATDLVQVPLTLEDVLHPQEDDVIPDQVLQHLDIRYLEPILHDRTQRLSGGYFLGDCLVDWGVPGIRNHSPDLVVFRDVTRPPVGNFGTFRLRIVGGRCVLVIEIVSPHTRNNDVVEKFREYYAVGVPLYVMVDQEREGGPRTLQAYRWTRRGYRRVPLDRQGRLLLKPLELRLTLEEERVVCYDAETSERLGDYGQERQARQAAERRAREAQSRIQKLEADLRRLRGEAPNRP